ncbi:hypothetical protein [Corynebacterium halotolerans]|uniref:hypothetical protein n=1 Tax=Corynebacterium halotolerans TaxID=225326 RepID=UPI003CEA5E9A
MMPVDFATCPRCNTINDLTGPHNFYCDNCGADLADETSDVDLEDMAVDGGGNFGWECPNCGAVAVGYADDEDDDYLCSCGHDVRETVEDDEVPVPNIYVDGVPVPGALDAAGRLVPASTLNDEDDERAGHTPTDSLIYLVRAVNGLIDLAVDDIHGVYADTITDTEDLPEHLSDAVSALETAARIIQHEATLHGAYRRRSYDNGVPTSGVRKEPHLEPQDNGTHRMVFTDVHYDLYPDGVAFHPISRDYKETA